MFNPKRSFWFFMSVSSNVSVQSGRFASWICSKAVVLPFTSDLQLGFF